MRSCQTPDSDGSIVEEDPRSERLRELISAMERATARCAYSLPPLLPTTSQLTFTAQENRQLLHRPSIHRTAITARTTPRLPVSFWLPFTFQVTFALTFPFSFCLGLYFTRTCPGLFFILQPSQVHPQRPSARPQHRPKSQNGSAKARSARQVCDIIPSCQHLVLTLYGVCEKVR